MGIRVGIALGSNLGNRLANLRQARDMLRKLASPGSSFIQAPIYQSEPVECADGAPDFYNTVVEIDYIGKPYELLSMTQGIEFHLGRKATYEINAPRVIDLDILYMGDVVMKDDVLNIPHPRMLYRRFVLKPLNEIRPDMVLPGDVTTIAEQLKHLESDEPPLSMVQSVW